jgi:hypothetical protein
VTQTRPWSTQVVEGEPIQVGFRQFIPVVKMRSAFRRRVTFGTNRAQGGGGGVVWMQPVAVIEQRTDGSQQRISIVDQRAAAVQGLLMGALALPLLYVVVLVLKSLWRRQTGSKPTFRDSSGGRS